MLVALGIGWVALHRLALANPPDYPADATLRRFGAYQDESAWFKRRFGAEREREEDRYALETDPKAARLWKRYMREFDKVYKKHPYPPDWPESVGRRVDRALKKFSDYRKAHPVALPPEPLPDAEGGAPDQDRQPTDGGSD